MDRAAAVIWKLRIVAEKRCRRLKAPALMKNVWLGVQHVDGLGILTAERVAA